MLKKSKDFIQAYRQAPWRRQMQMIGFVVAGVLALAVVAALYLDITARAATTGRMVQTLQTQRADTQQRIENLETELAFITSIEVMQKRATDMGFAPMPPGAITYLPVDLYQGVPSVQLAPRAGADFTGIISMPPEYTQSLFDWLGDMLSALGGG
jgi:hypothetical protein